MVKKVIQNVDYLADVTAEFVFYLNDGRILHNLIDLSNAFVSMSNELYAYHVTLEKNDFCNWISDVIHDDKLVKDLKKVNNKEEAGKIISHRVSYLQGKRK